MNNIIEVRNLEKSYKDNKVIKGITFEVERGEILCFLGPNGAGKSTTINVLIGALGYDKGDIYYKNRKIVNDDMEFKKCLGIVPQDISLYEDISAEKNIRFFASLYGLKGKELDVKTEEALEFAGLTDRKFDKVKTFSGGMKRRLNIACAIAHNPEVLIMDEPTVGIDPQSRNHILSCVKKMRDKGITIIYTTHYMEEVEEISTRIIVMDKGEIIAEGTKEKLKEEVVKYKKLIIDADNLENVDLEEFYNIEGVKKIRINDDKIEIETITGIENLDKIIIKLVNMGVAIRNLTCKTASLENVFLSLTGKTLRD
ncbi:ABC transporter ATP-binding protein [Clostridium gasigenes]|uniref:ABC-2 type transport system ATP-binding protein n=1 Tax=Clostridium gasigenes TaxID=94869 RepID=A0A1H0M063_9CLOT|nr:ABC transporter ATP-binding protein [Clostridium gasigenes]SDO73596.1 ABC-2 type transport system ATP-binding protein [Clostridium gasigenes]